MRARIRVGAIGTIEQWDMPDIDAKNVPLDAAGKFDAQAQFRALGAASGITLSGEDDSGTAAFMSEFLRVFEDVVRGWTHDSDQRRLEGNVSRRVTRNMQHGHAATVSVGVDHRSGGYRVSVRVDLNGIQPESFTGRSARNCAVLAASVLAAIGERSAYGRWHFSAGSARWFSLAAAELTAEGGAA